MPIAGWMAARTMVASALVEAASVAGVSGLGRGGEVSGEFCMKRVRVVEWRHQGCAAGGPCAGRLVGWRTIRATRTACNARGRRAREAAPILPEAEIHTISDERLCIPSTRSVAPAFASPASVWVGRSVWTPALLL